MKDIRSQDNSSVKPGLKYFFVDCNGKLSDRQIKPHVLHEYPTLLTKGTLLRSCTYLQAYNEHSQGKGNHFL